VRIIFILKLAMKYISGEVILCFGICLIFIEVKDEKIVIYTTFDISLPAQLVNLRSRGRCLSYVFAICNTPTYIEVVSKVSDIFQSTLNHGRDCIHANESNLTLLDMEVVIKEECCRKH
jgi:hypothetical protein